MRPPRALAAIVVAACIYALAGCSATSGGQSAGAPTAAASPAAPTTTEQVVENVTLALSVKTDPGGFGDYLVNLHDGKPAAMNTFHADSAGKWSKTITVPNRSMVKLDVSRTGATCEIKMVDTGQVLKSDENSCIVGG